MWILPKNYPLSLAFAQDMAALKEDLTLQGLNIESSLMWRSKPSPLRTWLPRWNRVSWLQHLYTRILKPSQHTSFETKLALSLVVIPVSHFQEQGSEKELTTQDTCGLTYGDTLNQLDLFPASLKTSKDTLASDSEMSLANWNKMVIKQRGEYSQRLRSARATKGKEFLFWPTPCARDCRDDGDMKAAQTRHSPSISAMVRRFPQEREVSPTIGKMHDLNPGWVEQMMGLPIKWTDLGSWETE